MQGLSAAKYLNGFYHLINIPSCFPTITEMTLSLQLKDLEAEGIIKRKVYTTKPPLKVEYSLTDFGKTLIPILQSISSWGYAVVNEK